MDCCICFEKCENNIIECSTCKIILHIKCIIDIIEKSSQYTKCPHCRYRLPYIFDSKIMERSMKEK